MQDGQVSCLPITPVLNATLLRPRLDNHCNSASGFTVFPLTFSLKKLKLTSRNYVTNQYTSQTSFQRLRRPVKDSVMQTNGKLFDLWFRHMHVEDGFHGTV